MDLELIKERYNSPYSADEIKKAIDLQKNLSLIVKGEGLTGYVSQVKRWEDIDQFEARRSRAKSTKHIFARVLRPCDKIFSSKDTVITYGLQEDKELEYQKYLTTLNGISIMSFLKNIWLDKFHTDPNGLIYIENTEDVAYPVYKSIKSIKDYKANGRIPEYVIFNAIDFKQLYKQYGYVGKENFDYIRVVDNKLDVIYQKKGEIWTEFEVKTNIFGKVPAFFVSDIPSSEHNIMTSYVEDAITVAKEWIFDDSIKQTFKMQHGFAIYWEYRRPCLHCDGTGYEKDSEEKCKICHGSGIRTGKDVSDKIVLPVPDNTSPNITPPAGYVTPDLGGWAQLNEELRDTEQQIEESMWGTHRVENAQNETATARFLDVQPVYDKLNNYSELLEKTYKLIADLIGRHKYTSWKDSTSVKMGRRYQIETPDQLLETYTNARSSGLSETELDYLLLRYISSEYQNEPMELDKHEKLFKIEPYKHLTFGEAKSNLPEPEYQKKILFSQWKATLKTEEILKLNIDQLKTKFNEFKGTTTV